MKRTKIMMLGVAVAMTMMITGCVTKEVVYVYETPPVETEVKAETEHDSEVAEEETEETVDVIPVEETVVESVNYTEDYQSLNNPYLVQKINEFADLESDLYTVEYDESGETPELTIAQNGQWLAFYNYDTKEWTFKYGYNWLPDPSFYYSWNEITTNEMMSMSEDQLWKLKNEFYARRGCKFNNSELQSYFKSQDWYMPISDLYASDFDLEYFNDIEKYNINSILLYTEQGSVVNDVFDDPEIYSVVINYVGNNYSTITDNGNITLKGNGYTVYAMDSGVSIYDLSNNRVAYFDYWGNGWSFTN